MTGPQPLHVIQVPGIGDELLKAVQPLLEVMQRRRELALQREQVGIARAANTERQREFDLNMEAQAAQLAWERAQLERQGAFIRSVLGATGVPAAPPAPPVAAPAQITPTQGGPVPMLLDQAVTPSPSASIQPTPTGPLGALAGIPDTALPGAVAGVGGVQAILKMNQDRQVADVLRRFDAKGLPWTQENIGNVVRKVAAIDPETATKVATAFGGFLPDYTPHVNDDGSVSWIPKNPGGIAGAAIQAKPATLEQTKLADYGTRMLNAHAIMTRLEHLDPIIAQRVDEKMRPVMALGKIPGAGPAAQTMFSTPAFKSMTEAEREYFFARVDFANAILRQRSGATIRADELETEMQPYSAPLGTQGSDPALVRAMQARRFSAALGTIQGAGPGFNPNLLTPLGRRYLTVAIAGHLVPAGLLPQTPQEQAAQQATELIRRQSPRYGPGGVILDEDTAAHKRFAQQAAQVIQGYQP